MPRRSRSQITRKMAGKIVKKLKAKLAGGGSHKQYEVYDDNDVLAATFTVRHGSADYLGHDHLMGELKVNAHRCKCLAWCTFSRNQYLQHLRDIGEL